MAVTGIKPFPFQAEAIDKMVGARCLLLATHMGLGKTVCTVAALEELIDAGDIRRGLIIVPSSLKFQWQEQIYRFTRKRALVIDGTKPQRLRQHMWAQRYQYVILSYQAVLNDWAQVKRMDLDFIVIDEATQIKGLTANRSRKVKFLAKHVPVRYALTGQPVENRPEELFSIMEFVDREVLGDPEVFDKTFIRRDGNGKVLKFRNLNALQKRMAPVLIRKNRTDPDVASQLPKVLSTAVGIPLGTADARLYKLVCEDLLEHLTDTKNKFGGGFDVVAHYSPTGGGVSMKAAGEIMTRMLALRLLCDDPTLLVDSARKWSPTSKGGSKYAAQLLAAGHLDYIINRRRDQPSAKRIALREAIEELLAEDRYNKVVIFSTFKRMLELLRDDTLTLADSVIYNGDMSPRAKNAAKLRFKNDPYCRIFLSSDAGGYGVDIPEANYLFSADLPWSAGAFEQRESRIIRLSSEWPHVDIRQFVMLHSIEEFILAVLGEKKGIAGAFLDGAHDQGNYTVSIDTLTDFLLAQLQEI